MSKKAGCGQAVWWLIGKASVGKWSGRGSDCQGRGPLSTVRRMATSRSSRSLTARQRARAAMATELEKAKQRETALVSVFTAIDDRDKTTARLGQELQTLIELGETHTSAAELTGLSPRDISTFVKAATQPHAQDTSNETTNGDNSEH